MNSSRLNSIVQYETDVERTMAAYFREWRQRVLAERPDHGSAERPA